MPSKPCQPPFQISFVDESWLIVHQASNGTSHAIDCVIRVWYQGCLEMLLAEVCTGLYITWMTLQDLSFLKLCAGILRFWFWFYMKHKSRINISDHYIWIWLEVSLQHTSSYEERMKSQRTVVSDANSREKRYILYTHQMTSVFYFWHELSATKLSHAVQNVK